MAPRGDFSLADLAGAALRPMTEFGMLLADPIYWGLGVPRGDGRPVLVLPGLFAGDGYLQPLRDWLGRYGYSPVKSGIERNPGWSSELIDALADVAQCEHRRSRQRVTIIGHSMGGLQGRSVAARLPQVVRHVIALGSPLAMAREPLPGAVRMTAIYSREDRIVRHPAALARDPRAKNVSVPGSHIGLAFNPAVYRVLARTLGAPDLETV
jgi:pimeloyl-ACP methyl ester carboxylesterase